MPRTLGDGNRHFETMPGSLTKLVEKYNSCWIKRGDPIFKYKIAIRSYKEVQKFFGKSKNVDIDEYLEIEMLSPVSGLIIGFNDSDTCTLFDPEKNKILNSNVWSHCLPVILLPKHEARPSICGYNRLIGKLKHHFHVLTLLTTGFMREEQRRILNSSMTGYSELHKEFESIKEVDEISILKSVPLDKERHAYKIGTMENLQSQNTQLSRQLAPIIKKHIASDWMR